MNNDTSELLKPLLQIKTENSQGRTMKLLRKTRILRFKNENSFIDHLIEGQETKLLKCNKEMDAKTALKLEFESRSLPVVPLFRFNVNASKWPEFIECFYTRVHCKSSFDDSMRMTYLISAVDGEAKRTIEAVGTSGLFYASVLKTLKREFGNNLLVAHLHLKSMLDKPQIKPNDRAALREFHQQIKLNLTWLSSLDYETPLYSYDTVTKALLRLPYALRKEFYKFAKDSSLIDGSLNLIMLERWLEKQLNAYFNPLTHQPMW